MVAVQEDLASEAGPDGLAAAVGSIAGSLRVIVNNAGITRDARLINMTPDDFAGGLGNQSRGRPPAVDRCFLAWGRGRWSPSVHGRISATSGSSITRCRRGARRADPDPRPHPGPEDKGQCRRTRADRDGDDDGDACASREKMVTAIPLGHMGLPEEVAETVAFLASGCLGVHHRRSDRRWRRPELTK